VERTVTLRRDRFGPIVRSVPAIPFHDHPLVLRLRAAVADETTLLLVLAAGIGAATGVVVTAFYGLIDLLHGLMMRSAARVEVADALVLPLVAGLGLGIARLLVHRGTHDSDGETVADVMYRVTAHSGLLHSTPVLVKSIASAIVIGTGGSVGAEGPVVVAGAATAARIGRWLRASPNRQRTLVGCGAAAGLSAAFNAPIAGVLFAVEKILGSSGGLALGPHVVASIVATAVARTLLGNHPVLALPTTFGQRSPADLLSYAVLGVITGLGALAYNRGVWATRDAMRRFGAFGQVLIAALGVGLLNVLFRGALWGRGHETLDFSLVQGRGAAFLLALSGAKLVATALSLAAAGAGGVFTPALFIGATLGGAVGVLSGGIPSLAMDPGAAALAGMAGVVAGATHAPLTAVLMVVEMTGDYALILPLLLAAVVAYAVARRLYPESIYTEWLVRKGVHLVHGADAAVMARVTVRECMNAHATTLPPDATLDDVRRLARGSRQEDFPLADSRGRLHGLVRQSAILEAFELPPDTGALVLAADLAHGETLRVTPDDSVLTALRRLAVADAEALPVVSSLDRDRLVGVVSRRDLMAAYERALTAEPH